VHVIRLSLHAGKPASAMRAAIPRHDSHLYGQRTFLLIAD
jgi:hypothetical protein